MEGDVYLLGALEMGPMAARNLDELDVRRVLWHARFDDLGRAHGVFEREDVEGRRPELQVVFGEFWYTSDEYE